MFDLYEKLKGLITAESKETSRMKPQYITQDSAGAYISRPIDVNVNNTNVAREIHRFIFGQ